MGCFGKNDLVNPYAKIHDGMYVVFIPIYILYRVDDDGKS